MARGSARVIGKAVRHGAEILQSKGKLDRDRYLRALRVQSPGLLGIGLVLLVVGVWALLEVIKGPFPLSPSSWGPVVFVLLLGIFVLATPYITVRRALATSRILNEPIQGTASDEGIMVSSTFGKSELPWGAFYRARASADVVLLYISANQFHLVMKDFFATAEDWESFKVLVRANVKTKRSSKWAFLLWLFWFVIVVVVTVIFMRTLS